ELLQRVLCVEARLVLFLGSRLVEVRLVIVAIAGLELPIIPTLASAEETDHRQTEKEAAPKQIEAAVHHDFLLSGCTYDRGDAIPSFRPVQRNHWGKHGRAAAAL